MMDYSDELAILRKKYPTTDEKLLTYELEQARAVINIRRRFTIDETNSLYIDPKYRYLLVPLVCASLDKDGATGQVGHSENGVNRSYENGGNYPNSLLAQIIPLIGTYTVTVASV